MPGQFGETLPQVILASLRVRKRFRSVSKTGEKPGNAEVSTRNEIYEMKQICNADQYSSTKSIYSKRKSQGELNQA